MLPVENKGSSSEERVRAWFAKNPNELGELWDAAAAVMYAAEMKFTRGPPMPQSQMDQYGYTFPNQEESYRKFWESHYRLDQVYLDVCWLKGRENASHSKMFIDLLQNIANATNEYMPVLIQKWISDAMVVITKASLIIHKTNFVEASTRKKQILDMILASDSPEIVKPPPYVPEEGKNASPRQVVASFGEAKVEQPAAPIASPRQVIAISAQPIAEYRDAQGLLHRDADIYGRPQPAVIPAQGIPQYWWHGTQFYPR